MPADLYKYVVVAGNHTTLNPNNGIYKTLLSKVAKLLCAPAEWETVGRYFKTLSRDTQSAALKNP